MPYISSTDFGSVRSTSWSRSTRRSADGSPRTLRRCDPATVHSRSESVESRRREREEHRSAIRAPLEVEDSQFERGVPVRNLLVIANSGMAGLVHARHQRRTRRCRFVHAVRDAGVRNVGDRQEFVTQLGATRSIASVATRSFSPSPGSSRSTWRRLRCPCRD